MEPRDTSFKGHRPSYELTASFNPHFMDQAVDDTRQVLITSAAETEHGLGSDTSISGNVLDTNLHTEVDALLQTKELLEEAMTNPDVSGDIAMRAEDIYENLTFIGEKELTEATDAIAKQWKSYLVDTPDLSLFIVTNTSFDTKDTEPEDDNIYDSEIGYVSRNKSDEYILDNVLSNFSDEELQEYESRLVFSSAEYGKHNPEQVKTIVLDDWIMSGQQMHDTLDAVFEHTRPSDVEINLVVCNEDRLVNGFKTNHRAEPVPVKAHFIARPTNHPYASEFGGAYLTAAHSTGDYPFEGTIQDIIGAVNETASSDRERFYMPPLANIVRPYYSPDYQPRYVARLKVLRAMGATVLLNS